MCSPTIINPINNPYPNLVDNSYSTTEENSGTQEKKDKLGKKVKNNGTVQGE